LFVVVTVSGLLSPILPIGWRAYQRWRSDDWENVGSGGGIILWGNATRCTFDLEPEDNAPPMALELLPPE
jgi:hypothetical protein